MTPANPKALQRISASEFARRLSHGLDTQDKRYAFFLGSGCSVTSGIKTAGGLVADEWLPMLRDFMAPDQMDHEAWGATEFGYDPKSPAASYGILMKRLFLQPEEQQREIERLCDNKFPAFGYFVLAALMDRTKVNGTFNVVLTTNFDDLVADALYLFTPIRPLLIHHESLANYIRPTRTRPLIVKLHGDNHLSPFNTPEQTASLPENTNKQVSSLLHDRGLIFLGYSGNDQSVVRLLEELPKEALPLGIYWCSQTEPDCQLSEWLHERGAVWVESPRFDEFMLLVHAAMNMGLPKPKRFEDVFDRLMQTYKVLTGDITKKPTKTPAQAALKAAVEKTDKAFPNWRATVLEAYRFEKSNPEKAEIIYKDGIKRFPESSDMLGNYALFLADQKRPQEAEAYYKRAVEADPTNSTTLGNYAILLTKEKRPQEAETYYRRAIEANPTVNNLGNYALLLAKEKRPQEAEAYYKRAVEADPTDAYFLGGYATFLADQKQPQQAEAFYKRGLEADPTNADVLGNYALFLTDQKRLQEAETHYKRAIEADPSNADVLGSYALFLADQKRPQEAEAYYKRATEADPSNANNLGNYAIFLAKEKRPQEAEAHYKRAVEADPTHANNLGNYAFFLTDQKRPQEAEVHYKRAIEADPTHANNLGNYAIFLAKEKRPQEAEAHYKRAVEADPTANNLGSYAVFLTDQKRPQEAEEYYKRAIEADPTNAIALSNYAQLVLAIDPVRGLELLDLAQVATDDDTPFDLLLELGFYELVHRPLLGKTVQLTHLKSLLKKDGRSKGWNFMPNIDRAIQDGHPFAEWLPKLAAVIADEAPLETLAEWPEWQQAEA